MLADAERHRSTRKDSRQGFGSKLVSICTRARVGGRFWAICGAFGDMAKMRITRNDLRANFGKVLAVGYCDAVNLLRYSSPFGYACGVYGWNFDAYEVGGVAICTGYRPAGKSVKYDLLREYEAKAEKIAKRKNWKRETKARKVAELLREFVALC